MECSNYFEPKILETKSPGLKKRKSIESFNAEPETNLNRRWWLSVFNTFKIRSEMYTFSEKVLRALLCLG